MNTSLLPQNGGLLYEDDLDTVDCWNCCDGYLTDTCVCQEFEDTCCCLEPEEQQCRECNGTGVLRVSPEHAEKSND